MKCLRCGYCCKTYMVIIVDDPEKGTVDNNLKAHMGDGPCQHLRGDKPGEYSCFIHGYSWYEETPCFSHGQIEQKDSECRLGRWILNEEKNDQERKTNKRSQRIL